MNELLEKNGWELFLPKKNAIIDLFYFEHNLSAADLFILQKWVLCIVYALSCFYFVLLMLKIYFMWILNVMEGGLIFPPSPAKLVNLRKKWTMQVQPSYFFFQGIWKKKTKPFFFWENGCVCASGYIQSEDDCISCDQVIINFIIFVNFFFVEQKASSSDRTTCQFCQNNLFLEDERECNCWGSSIVETDINGNYLDRKTCVQCETCSHHFLFTKSSA